MTGFELCRIDGFGAPFEGNGSLVVVLNEGIDSLSDLGGRGEAGAFEGGAGQDREPDLDLVEPTCVGSIIRVTIKVPARQQ